MNILKAEGEVRRSGRARRSTRKGDRKRKRGEEDEDELEELEERKPTRQSKRSKSKAKKQASSDEEGDVSFIFFVFGFGHWVDFGLGSNPREWAEAVQGLDLVQYWDYWNHKKMVQSSLRAKNNRRKLDF